jgi:HK97 family phage major capsid protein
MPPELAVQLEEVKGMLQEVQNNLETKTEDGQVIKLLDMFKMFPALQEKYQGLEARLQAAEEKIKARKYMGLPGLEMEADKFSILRAIQYIKNGVPLENWKNAQFEADVFRQTAQQRTMSTTDDTVGGYLVPAQAMPEFIELFNAQSVCIRMGARVLENLMGAPVTFVKQTGGATAYWVGEGEPPTASDLATGLLKMVPKKVMALTYINNELIRRSNPGAEALVRQDFATRLGLAIDLACLRGSGSENQPLGIAQTSGINTVTLGTGNGAVPNWQAPWVDMEYELSVDNALLGRLGFVFHPAIKRALKKLRNPYYSGDTGGEYPLLPVTDEIIAGAIGYPFAQTTQLPINLTTGESTNCTEIFFGNWAELLIGQWMGFEILASNVAGTSFTTDQTWVRIISEVDTALRHAESMCLCNSARIAAS